MKINETRYAMGKNLEYLSFYQRKKLEYMVENSPVLADAQKLKELARLVFHAGSRDEAEDDFEEFSLLAKISKLEPFMKLGESLLDHWDKQGLSNARIKANNNKIKLMIRKAFGFRIDNGSPAFDSYARVLEFAHSASEQGRVRRESLLV